MPRVLTRHHQWVAATHIDLTDAAARRGVKRGTVRVPAETKVEILEVYCALCRRAYEDVVDQPCPAFESTEHLHGGPIGERAKRKHPYHDCERYDCHEGESPYLSATPPAQPRPRRAAL